MIWSELYNKEHKPSDNQIKDFVETALWDDLSNYLQQTYNIKPQLFYSCCAMDNNSWKGWNIKCKKSGKALCTLYPKPGYFLALINIGAKEATEADLMIPFCDQYTKEVYNQAIPGRAGKSLAINVTTESILNDVKDLISLRISPATKK